MLRSIAIGAEGVFANARGSADSLMDQAAFRDLYEQAAPRLRGYLRRAVGTGADAALADDLLQETFLKLLGVRLPAAVIADDRQLRAYLYRVATNLLNDHWRRVQRERRSSLLSFVRGDAAQRGGSMAARSGSVGESGDRAANLADVAVDPAQRDPQAQLEMSLDMSRAFARLKPQEQSLLWLAYVEGFDHGEIAVALNVGERSVRVLLHRARRRLALALSEPRP